jgi:hypothetical protein
MSGEALFVGWGEVVRGREQLALQVFQEAIAYYSKLQQDGKISSFDTVLLEPHGGDLAGFIVMHGDQSSLDSIRSSPEFQKLTTRSGGIVHNIGVVSAYTGDALGAVMGIFGEVSQGLPQAS